MKMRFDALRFLVEIGPDREIAFESLEGGLDLHQLRMELPEFRGIRLGETGAQEVAPFAAANLSERFSNQPVGEVRAA